MTIKAYTSLVQVESPYWKTQEAFLEQEALTALYWIALHLLQLLPILAIFKVAQMVLQQSLVILKALLLL